MAPKREPRKKPPKPEPSPIAIEASGGDGV
jgi:hypothetical protein